MLMVGRRNLATSEPMGVLWVGSSWGQGLCELDGDGGEKSCSDRALKFKCPAWPGGLQAGNSCCHHSRPFRSRLSPTAKFLLQPVAPVGRCSVSLVSPGVVSKGVKGNVVHARFVRSVRSGCVEGEDCRFACSPWGHTISASHLDTEPGQAKTTCTGTK